MRVTIFVLTAIILAAGWAAGVPPYKKPEKKASEVLNTMILEQAEEGIEDLNAVEIIEKKKEKPESAGSGEGGRAKQGENENSRPPEDGK